MKIKTPPNCSCLNFSPPSSSMAKRFQHQPLAGTRSGDVSHFSLCPCSPPGPASPLGSLRSLCSPFEPLPLKLPGPIPVGHLRAITRQMRVGRERWGARGRRSDPSLIRPSLLLPAPLPGAVHQGTTVLEQEKGWKSHPAKATSIGDTPKPSQCRDIPAQ